jgi:hypothetical protein
MLNGFPDVEQATLALQGEGLYRFSSFSSADAVTLVRPFRNYAFFCELTCIRVFQYGKDSELRHATRKAKDL